MSLFFVRLARNLFFDKAYYSVPQRNRSLTTCSFAITLNIPMPISNMLLVHHFHQALIQHVISRLGDMILFTENI